MFKDIQKLNSSRIRTYDFLKGLSIIGVIAVHCAQVLPTNINFINYLASLGRFGVQTFYFLSALTMCHLWEKNKNENSYKDFYIKRFIKIVPFYWIAMVIYFLSNNCNGPFFNELLVNLTLMQGFWPEETCFVPGGFAIGVLVNFYIIFPFIISKLKNRTNIYLFSAITIWIFNIFLFKNFIISLLSSSNYFNQSDIITYFLYINPINQLPIFFLGFYLHLILKSGYKKIDLFIISFWVFAAAILRIFFQIKGFLFLSLYITIGICLYLSIKANLRNKFIEKIGQKTYYIFLFHTLIVGYLKIFLTLKNGIFSLLIHISAVLLLSYILASIIKAKFEPKIKHFYKSI